MATLTDYASGYSSVFYTGTGAADSGLVPGSFPVAVNGRPYVLDTDWDKIRTYGDFFREDSIKLLRDQADQGKQPGEQSLSPASFWRRSQDTWHKGAGQSMLDRETSDPARFHSSKGVNPWNRYELSLLNSTSQVASSGPFAGLFAVVASGRLYVSNLNGSLLRTTTDLSVWTTVTGLAPQTPQSLATNGSTVWTAHGSDGIYATSGTAGSSYVTGTVTLVGYAKGRLLAANGAALYNPITSGALPAPLVSLGDPGFAWVAFAEGASVIYAAGTAGDVSRVYRIGIDPATTSLTAPIVAATLPTGERVRSIRGYLGYVVLGTDKGVRFATADANGDLTLGSLIPTPGPVYALDAADRFVWFGWSAFDATSSGLGRLDLQTINDGFTPAYASDLMASVAGTVRATVALGSRRVFTIDSDGVWAEGTSPVASGWVRSGQITYGIADAKVPVYVDLKHAPLPSGASVAVGLSLDRAAAATVGTSNATGSVSPGDRITTSARRAEESELTVTLTAGAGGGPTLTRWTLLAYPAPAGASMVTLPILLAPRVENSRGSVTAVDVEGEFTYLRALNDSREIVTVQVGHTVFEGTVEEFTWLPDGVLPDRTFWRGTFVAKIRRIRG